MTDLALPWQYNFPPFFTMQLHAETRNKQLEVWRSILLNYCRAEKRCIIDITDISNSPSVFKNEAINRSLSKEDLLILFEYLQNRENAEPMDSEKKRWIIYWRPLNNLADVIYDWVENNGLRNSVCTLYELTSHPNEEFSDLNEIVLTKALEVLQNRNKAKLLTYENMSGVKFL